MVEIEHWQVFPRGANGGNPCPLVTDARKLTARQMRAIAAHYGHESVFVTEQAGATAELRFFVPRHEMRMCVHATVAVVSALAGAGILTGGQAVIGTPSGTHRVSWDDGDPAEVTVEQHPPSYGPPADVHQELAAALRLTAGAIAADAEIRPVSVSRAKLIVPVRDADTVHRAEPDFPALWELCRRLDATGAYLFAPHPDGDARHLVARQFPVDAGFGEDPATGVAAAALAAYLAGRDQSATPGWTRITIDQGDAMGQPSRLSAGALVELGGIKRTSVTGRAVRTGREELSLDAIAARGNAPQVELR